MKANVTLGAAVLVCIGLHATARADTYTFTSIDIPGAGPTTPSGINDLGKSWVSPGMSLLAFFSGSSSQMALFPRFRTAYRQASMILDKLWVLA